MNPAIQELSEMSDNELKKIACLTDDNGLLYPIIWFSKQENMKEQLRYLHDCPVCFTHIEDSTMLFYVEQGFEDGTRESAEPPIWCLACPECNTYSWICEEDEI